MKKGKKIKTTITTDITELPKTQSLSQVVINVKPSIQDNITDLPGYEKETQFIRFSYNYTEDNHQADQYYIKLGVLLAFIKEEFEGGRHQERLNKIKHMKNMFK